MPDENSVLLDSKTWRATAGRTAPSPRRQLWVTLAAAALGLLLAVALSVLKFRTAVETAAHARMGVPVAAVKDALEAALGLGLPLASATAVPDLLARERATDAAIVAIVVFDPAGRVQFSTAPPPGAATVAGDWLASAQRSGPSGWRWRDPRDERAVAGAPLTNAFNLVQGHVAVLYSLQDEGRAVRVLAVGLLKHAAWALALAGVLAGAVLTGAVRAWPRRSAGAASAHPTVALLLSVWVALLAWAVPARGLIEDSLRPQLERQAAVLAQSVSRLVGTALGHGLTLGELRGVEDHLDALRRQHPALAWIAVKAPAGAVQFASGRAEATGGPEVAVSGPAPAASTPAASSPAASPGPAATVAVHVAAAYLQDTLRESALDLLVVLVVAAVIVRELLHYVAQAGPARAEATPGQRLARLRVPLLLFMLAEELTRALVPGFARDLAQGLGTGAAADLLAGLPIVVFMAVVALGQPVLAVWAERTGRRRALAWGVALGAAGLAGAATADSVGGFVAWRALAGLGWAGVFVAAQGTVVAHTSTAERTRAFAGFVSAILVAGVCGPPLGGLVADHLGTRWGFVLAAAVAGAAGLALRLLPSDPSHATGPGQVAASTASPSSSPSPSPLTRQALPRLLRHRGFVTLTFGAALPAKLLLAGLCFYLVPLVLAAQGAPAAATGRAQMVYALALLALMPLATRAAESGVPAPRLVGGGLALSTLGGLGIAALAAAGGPPGHSVAAIVVAMALLGAGQGLSIAAQSALLTTWCADESARHGPGALLGYYRLFERLGNATGPLVAGALVAAAGAGAAFGAVAGAGLAAAGLFLWRSRALKGAP